MNMIVIFDSFFGNTEKIARAIAEGLGKDACVVMVNECTLKMLEGVDLLMVGSPTRAFSPSPAIKSFATSIPKGSLKGVKGAVFDTRMDVATVNSKLLTFMTRLFGFAAEKMHKQLVRAGCEMVIPSEGFIVIQSEGPLKEGELERAKAWGKNIRAQLS